MKASRARNRKSSAIVWILAAFCVCFVVWAKNAPLDEIVRGSGVLVPSSRNQIVQSLEGGILTAIHVREGDRVEAGQTIASLNETRFRAEVRDFEGQIFTLRARLMRLQAELEGATTFELPEEFWLADPDLSRSEEEIFIANTFDFSTKSEAAKERVALQAQEVELIMNMVDQRAMPAIDLIDARMAALEAQSALDSLVAEYRVVRAEAISELLSELARLTAQVEQSRDQLNRSTLVSPSDGIVNTIFTTTIGGVVQSGVPIFEITPLDDELLVEIRIRPEDIAFVYAKMDTTIKLTAYDYTIYGSLKGVVTQISADTFEDTESPDSIPYYKVLVSVDATSLAKKAGVFEIRPGMLAEAELYVGSKTVLQYLITPLIKTSEALREP